VDEIKVFRQKRIDGQDRTGVPYRPSSQASSDLSNSKRFLGLTEINSLEKKVEILGTHFKEKPRFSRENYLMEGCEEN
jgi:hypothetical protein